MAGDHDGCIGNFIPDTEVAQTVSGTRFPKHRRMSLVLLIPPLNLPKDVI